MLYNKKAMENQEKEKNLNQTSKDDIINEQSPLFPDGALKVEGKNRSFVFTKGMAWLLVGIITFGFVLFNLLGFTIFKQTVEITQYEWSSTDTFDAKNYDYITANQDGKVRILQLTDLHFLNGVNVPDKKTFDLAQRLIDATNPDLIVLTGDVVFTWSNHNTLKRVIEFFDNICKTRNIYWTMVFGNHDETGFCDKKVLADTLSASKYCLFKIGPTNLDDNKYGNCLGNYAINLKTSEGKIACSLIMMDSNASGTTTAEGTYAPISYSTISWYEWFVNGMTAQNNGTPVTSLAFFHIPLVQSRLLMQNETLGQNGYNEKVCSSNFDTGLFAKMEELNSTIATFSGHDHQNYYQGKLPNSNVLLTNCVSVGYCTYGDVNLKGGRVIDLDLNSPDLALDTYILFEKDV
ncbi:MAG: metallophosphoesterase [Clostridia bacterium]|nr:metallophosphoesterase [Clostridia bacterium]